MASADGAGRVPWLRYALLGAVFAAICLAISLFSSTIGASAEEAEPVDPVSVAGGTSDPAPPAAAEPAVDAAVGAPTSGDAEAADHRVTPEPAPAPAPAPPPQNDTPPGLAASPGDDAPAPQGVADKPDQAVTPPPSPAPTPQNTAPPGLTEKADHPAPVPAPTPQNTTPPGLVEKADHPAPVPAPTPQNTAPPGLTEKADQPDSPAPVPAPTPQNTTPPGLADKPVDAPAVEQAPLEHAPEALDTLGHLPADAVPPGLANAPGVPDVPEQTFVDHAAADSQVSGPPSDPQTFAADDWSTWVTSRTDTASVPADTSGTITPADGTPLGGAAPASPASGGGAGSGGAGSGGAGSGAAAGASGTSDVVFAAVGLGALASLVLHSVDDELPSSPVHDTDTTPD